MRHSGVGARRTRAAATVQSVFTFCAAVVLLMAGSATPAAAQTKPPAITDPRYFVGVNVPWLNWGCDFGCGVGGGVSSRDVRATLSTGFSSLQAAGIHTARWWVFPGDPLQITRDAAGAPAALKQEVYADFDAALALAEQHDLVYEFVLFSAPTAVPSRWMTDPAQRRQLANTLAPLFERYKDHPRILAWEVINEPEWDIWHNKIEQAAVQATVRLLAETIHARTSTPVTVGAANVEGARMWVGQGLDFHSPHWYDPMSSGLECARCSDAATIRRQAGLDGSPIVIGEFYAGPDTDTLQRFTDFRAKGFAGAWAWSLFHDKTGDKMRIDLAAAQAFIGRSAPAAPAAPATTPAASATPSSVSASRSVQLLANWASPTYALPGQAIQVHQDVTGDRDGNISVDFELYDSSGKKVGQAVLENQALPAHRVTSFDTVLPLPASLPAGQYTVKSGIFAPGWTSMLAWNDWVGTIVVESPPPPPPPVADEAAANTGDGLAPPSESADPGEPEQ